jgi:hypothetical protein
VNRARKLLLDIARPVPDFSGLSRNPEDLDALRTCALEHRLFMLLYFRLKKKHLNKSDDILAGFLKANEALYLTGAARSAVQEAAEAGVKTLLRGHGIVCLVIKGNAIARQIYEAGYFRASSDIDILIREEDIFRADDVLLGSGYLVEEQSAIAFRARRMHHAVYHHPAGHTVECHWNFGITGFFELSSGEIWQEVIFEDGVPARLSPEMTIIMLLMHHYMHFFRDLWVLVDILHALSLYGESIDQEAFGRRLRKIGLVRTALITFDQLADLWGEAAIEDLSPLKQSLKTRAVPRYLLYYFRINMEQEAFTQSRMDRFFARLALDRLSVIAGSFMKIFLPGPEIIKAYYGDNRPWILPYNYCRFILWRMRDGGRD